MWASLVTVETSFDTDLLDVVGLFRAASIFDLTIVKVTDDDMRRYQYAFMCADFKRLGFGGLDISEALFEKEWEFVIVLNKKNIKMLKKSIPTVEIYTIRRLLWPEEELKPRKKEEYEVTFHLLQDEELTSLVVFESQKSVLNYRIDCMFRLKSTTIDTPIPDILLEIDEDGHSSYDSDCEDQREELIKSFGYRYIRIPIKRGTKPSRVQKIAAEYASKIKTIAKDLLVQYSPELNSEEFLRSAEGCDLDRGLLQIYFPREEQRSHCFIRHDAIADYLGYDAGSNGIRYLTSIICKNLIREEDYEMEVDKGDIIVGGTTKNRGRPKHIYLLSRLAFYKICMYSIKPKARESQLKIVKLYDFALSYVKRLRASILSSQKSCDGKVSAVKGRIEQLKEQSDRRALVCKLKKQVEELKEKNKKLEEEMAKMQEKVDLNKELTKMLLRKQEEELVELLWIQQHSGNYDRYMRDKDGKIMVYCKA